MTTDKQSYELRTTLGKMEVALAAIAEAIVWTDRKGRIQWCNRSFETLVEYPRLKILGKPLTGLLPLSEHGVPLPEKGHPLNTLLDKKTEVNGRFEFGRKNERLVIEFWGKYLQTDEQNEFAVVVVRDITDIRQSAQARLQSAALHHAANAIAITDTLGNVLWVSPSFTRLTGYSLEEIYGRNLKILKSGKHDAAFYRCLWETIQSGRVWEGETVNRKKDGKLFVEQQTIAPVLDKDGRISHYIAIKQDVTARKQAEEELSRYRGHLEQMVAEKTRALELAQAELVNRAMEAGMSQMAAIGLHNIGNVITPLNVIMEHARTDDLGNLAQYLDKCLKDLNDHNDDLGNYVRNDERGRQVFAFMAELIGSLVAYEKKQSDLLGRMDVALQHISELLMMQQLYANGTQESWDWVDINGLLQDAIRLQSSAMEKRGVSVRCSCASDLPKIKINKNRLMQVVLNLIKNSYEAVDANASGNEPGAIEVSSHLRDDWIGFEIKDNGIGIDPMDIEKIGEIGQSQKGSTGFGLYYCRMFAKKNHGIFSLTSPGVGKGACASINFDVSRVVDKTERHHSDHR